MTEHYAKELTSRLYAMGVEDLETGEITMIYGHASANVIDECWQSYTDQTHRVIIVEVAPGRFCEECKRHTPPGVTPYRHFSICSRWP